MASDPDTYDLNELSHAAGVTPRTVRYYVHQGLLPSPGTRGPGTRYERPHLDRLQLIRRLQREHLPLAEIRKRLEALDDGGVRDALAASDKRTAPSSALDYVRDVLTRQPTRMVAEPPTTIVQNLGVAAHRPTVAEARTTASSAPAFGASLSRIIPPEGAESPQVSQPSRSTRSTWDRIPLAPDVELHVRRPLSREQNRQVERLLEAARDLFGEET